MQQKPETGEQERIASDTTPLSPYANITSFPTAHPWEGTGQHPRRWRGYSLPILGAVLVLLAIAVIFLTSPLGQALLSSSLTAGGRPPEGAQGRTVGSISFESSDQRSGLTSLGIADELQIDLTGIRAPAPGNSYYGWLLPDKNSPTAQTPAIALGKLPVEGGSIRVLYTDGLHRDLVGLAGAFLVTEEQTTSPPLQPSPDQATWRYQATFPQTPDPGDTVHHYTELDHLRHLLSEDPSLSAVGLHGGLDAWFFGDIQKVYESAGAAQGYFGQPGALPLLRTHLSLILEYLDGGRYAWLDLGAHPAAEAPFAAQVGLIQITAAPVPPAFVNHIDLDLKGVISAPGATGKLRALAEEIDHALAQVAGWLRELRTDVRHLVAMTDAQLLSPQAQPLLNDADTMAQYAFVGQDSPAANAVVGGATQIHYAILRLATLPVQALPFP
jgi:hypothetical protein